MGDAQSAQRGEEQEQPQGEQPEDQQLHVHTKPLKSESEFNGNADGSIADKITAEDGDFSEPEELCREETPLVSVEITEKEAPDANEDVCLDLTEMDAKQNDINESFKRFFSNIGLKFTVKKGSGEPAADDTNEEELDRPGEETAMETAMSENIEHNNDVNVAQEAFDNDSTTCPTLTDAETKEEVESDRAMSPEGEEEEEPRGASPSGSGEEEEELVVSPIKRFFSTGIFSGIRKKKKPEDEEPAEKELKDMSNKEDVEKQKDMEEVSLGVEAGEHEEPNGEPEIILSSQEKVQASPLKKLLSGSNLKKLAKKPRSRKSSDAKLSDSGEHVSDHLVSSTEKPTEKGSGQPSAEAGGGEEDSAWATFKKLLTPKRRLKKYSMINQETHTPGPEEEPKPSDGGQMSDHSTEEGKKQRKDSAHSWEAVLCGSGRRRSRKTSDSEDESPQDANKQGPELAQENVNEISASKQAGSPAEADGASTWKSLKRLVTPKRKAKDDSESKDNAQSDSELPQDDSFSVKKLLPGRKKRKSTEARQDQVSSDEADKEAASGDEDSETPAVIPLSEFDTVEMEIHVQTQAEVESPKEPEQEQELLDQMDEPAPPTCEEVQVGALEKEEPPEIPTAKEEAEDLTDSISKPQLSDIPEEATPASATEEAARDDTIAEDLMEITSDAVTAPEPLDTPQADETEMISAVSQLSSESSKTSGNTTPVPADYAVKETDLLLHQVVETISSPKEAPVCSEEPGSENVAVSQSHETLEKFDQEKPTILEKPGSLEATQGPNEELNAVNEQTENIPEVSVSVSTETVSEVPTEEFKTAEIAVDDVTSVDATNPDESIGELESVDSLLVEGNVAISTDILPESESIVPEDGSLVETPQTEEPELQSQDADSDGTKDHPPMELQELVVTRVATLESEEGSSQSLEKDVISEDTTTADTVTYELKEEMEPLPEVEQENEELVQEVSEAVQISTLDAEEGGLQIPDEGVKPEEPKQTECEVSAEPQNQELPIQEVDVQADTEEDGGQSLEKEEISENAPEETLQASPEPVDSPKPDQVQEPEVLEEVQAQTLDSEAVLSLEGEVILEDVPAVTTDEPNRKQEVEPEEKLPTEANDIQEPQVLEALDSEEGSVQSLEKEAISEDIAEGQTRTVTDEPLTDTSLKPAAIPDVETLKHEPKQEAEAQPEEKLPVEVVKTEDDQEGRSDLGTEILTESTAESLDQTSAGASFLKQEILLGQSDPEVSEDQKAETISLDVGSEQESLTPEVTAELQTAISLINEDASNIEDLEESVCTLNSPAPPADNASLINEPESGVCLSVVQARVEEEKESEFPQTEISAAVVEHVEVAQAVLCNFQETSAKISDVLVEETLPVAEPPIERRTSEREFKEEVETAAPLETDVAETAVEDSVVVVMNVPLVVDASKIDLRQPEVLESVVPDSEEGSGRVLEKEEVSKNVPEGESEEKTIPRTEASPQPADATKPEQVQEPEVLETVQEPLTDSQASNLQSLEKEVMSEVGTKEELISLTEASPEPADATKPEQVQEPEVVESVQEPSEASHLLVVEKEVTSEVIPAVETVPDGPKEETIPLTEASPEPEDAAKPEQVQEPEVSEAELIVPVEVLQVPIPDSKAGDVLSAEQEVTSELTTAGVTEEPISLTEASPEPADSPKPEQEPELEVEKVVQVQIQDSEGAKLLSLGKEVTSEVIPAVETVPEEPKEASPEPADATKSEQVQEPEIVETVQVSISDSKDLLSIEKEVTLEVIPAVETVPDEPKEETIPITKASPETADIPKPEQVQEPEIVETVQVSIPDTSNLLSIEKEVTSEISPAVETVPDEPKEETVPLTEASPKPEDIPKSEQVQEPEVVETVQVSIPEAKYLLSIEKEVTLEVSPAGETVPDEPKEETIPLTEASPEPEQVQEPEVGETVQVSISEPKDLLSIEKKVTLEVSPAVESVPDEPKAETVPFTEASPEPADTTKPEQVQEPEVEVVVQVQIPDSEASSLSLEKEVTSEVIPAVETVPDEPKEETIPLTEASPEPVDIPKPELVQAPEIVEAVQVSISEDGKVILLKKEVTSEVSPAVETVPDEPSPEPEVATKPEQVQEPEVIEAAQVQTPDSEGAKVLTLEKEVTSDVIPEPKLEAELKPEDILPEDASDTEVVQEPQILEGVPDSKEGSVQSLEKEAKQEAEAKQEDVPAEAVKTEDVQEPQLDVKDAVLQETSEGGSVQKKQILLEDVPKPTEKVASVPDGPEGEVMAQLDQYLDIAEDQKSKNVGTEQKVDASKVQDKVQSHIQEPEKTPKSPTPCLDKASVTLEPEHEVHLGAVCDRIEEEKEVQIPGSDITTAAFDHAIVAQVVVCQFKEVSAEIPDVLIEQTSPVSIPLVYNVPTVESQDNHRIQVQVVDDAESAEITGDVVLAQLAEQKQLTDGPCETVKELDKLSATPETEEEVINEENNVTVHQVTQHAKENAPEAEPEPESVTLEQVALNQTDVEVKESVTTSREEQDEVPERSEDLQQQPDVPGSSDVQKADTKVQQDKSEAVIIHEKAQIIQHQVLTPKLAAPEHPDSPGSSDVPSLVQKDDAKVEQDKSEAVIIHEKAQIIQHQVVTPTLAVPQQPEAPGSPDIQKDDTKVEEDKSEAIIIHKKAQIIQHQVLTPKLASPEQPEVPRSSDVPSLVQKDDAQVQQDKSEGIIIHEKPQIIQHQVVTPTLAVPQQPEVPSLVQKDDAKVVQDKFDAVIIHEKAQIIQHQIVTPKLASPKQPEAPGSPDIQKDDAQVEEDKSEAEIIHEKAQMIQHQVVTPRLAVPQQPEFLSLVQKDDAKVEQDKSEAIIEKAQIIQHQVLTPKLAVPQQPEVPSLVQKDDTKVEEDKSEAVIIHEKAQIIQHQVLTPKLPAPQQPNVSGSSDVEKDDAKVHQIVSPRLSAGNVESPSSPEPASVQRPEPLEKTDTSEVEGEPVKTNNKHSTLSNMAFQATVTTEPATDLESKDKVVITCQTALLAMAQQVQQIDSSEMEIATAIAPATETPQPEKSQEVIGETKRDEDQDVWLDAEDVIYSQAEIEEVPKVVSLEPEDQTGSEEEVETAKYEEEEGPRIVHTAVETGGTDSEEDFAIALEQPEHEIVCVATMK